MTSYKFLFLARVFSVCSMISLSILDIHFSFLGLVLFKNIFARCCRLRGNETITVAVPFSSMLVLRKEIGGRAMYRERLRAPGVFLIVLIAEALKLVLEEKLGEH